MSVKVACQNGLRWFQKAHFQQFWHLVAKWLPGGLRRLILINSATWWPNGFQMVAEQ
jgi:hypothetical protein